MKKILQKGLIGIVVLMMLFTNSMTLGDTVSALEQVQIVWEKQGDFYGNLHINVNDSDVSLIRVMNNGNVIEEMDIASIHDVKIEHNGTYTIVGYNQKKEEVFKENQIVSEFEDFIVKENKENQIDIYSRNPYSNYVEISKGENKTIVSLEKKEYGFFAIYDVEENGTYTIRILDFNDQEIAKTSIEVKSFASYSTQGVIEIKNVEDVKHIVKNPGQSYLLMNDIVLKDNVLSDTIFSGSINGNGYSITGSDLPLFKSLENATISNFTLKGSGLANTAFNTNIDNSGFYLQSANEKENAALIKNGQNVNINNSYVLANVEGKEVAGFILEGTAKIHSSYISGYLKGEKVYGFGKDVEVSNSYISASLVGEDKLLFTNGKKEGVFYDAQINDSEEKEAQAFTTQELTNKNLKIENFTLKDGCYPQIKEIDNAKESAKELSLLSVQALKNDGNLSAYENTAFLPKSEGIEWEKEKVSLYGNHIQLTKNNGEVFAHVEDNDTVLNRFAFKNVKTISEPKAGVSTTQMTTQITYPSVYGNYYKVLPSSEVAPTKPASHKEAIESGWKIVYWTGVNRATDLAWNTNYKVYNYDGTSVTSKELKTAKQSVNGTITLNGNYDLDNEMTIGLSQLPSDVNGTLYVEKSTTLNGTWSEIQKEENFELNDTLKFTPNTGLYYQYLRVRYVVDESLPYCGEFTVATSHVLACALSDENVKIENKKPHLNDVFSIGDKLSASINISGKERDATYAWYRESNPAIAIATGNNYTLQESDIGQKVFVVATAKTNSDVKGSAKSTSTKEVKPIKHAVPTELAKLVGDAEDMMFTIKMDVSEGLYQFKVVNATTKEEMEYPIIARAGIDTVIMSNVIAIEANSTYDVYVRRIGEYGYEDSEYSENSLTVNTNKKSVNGDVKLSGKMIYGKKISASVTTQEINQTGKFLWYRVTKEGVKEEIQSNDGLSEYTLEKEDIGKYIEVVYVGTGDFANEISTSSDRISKTESLLPTTNLVIQGDASDHEVDVTLPSENSKDYIIGFSKTKNGVPTEYKEDGKVKICNENTNYTLKGFDSNSVYYLFVRFNESDTETKSAWIDSDKAVSFTTKKTTFVGSINLVYENTEKPMRGQRIDAKLKSNNTNNGTWKWTRVAVDKTESAVFNYVLSDDKDSTYYIVPTNEEVGVTYKVEFIASGGYEGASAQTTKEVVDYELPKYNVPSIDNVALNTLNDTSISATMLGVEGQYRFRYKKASEPDASFHEIDKDVYADAAVVIDGLDRNTAYVVQVKQIKDAQGLASEWSITSSSQKTEKTEIAGFVNIQVDPKGVRAGTSLTATYASATYTPSGSDAGGKWSWYFDDTLLSGANNESVNLNSGDVNKVIKVKYTMPEDSDFKGSVTAQTDKVGKAYAKAPTITNITATKQDDTDDHMIVEVSGVNYTANQDMYYLIQNANNAVPSIPTSDVLGKWIKVTSSSFEIQKDVSNRDFASKSKYTLYLVSLENADTLSSDIVSKDVTIDDHTQKGTIEFSGKAHVGKEYTATLKNYNNTKGVWRWYYSNTNYNTTNPTSWTEIKEGFYPNTNSDKSTLTVSDVAKGKFLRAEFVADAKEGYVGTIKSTRSTASVTKTFTEKLTISGKGYEGELLTVTLSGSDRDLTKTGSTSDSQLFSTRTIQFQEENGGSITNLTNITNVTKNSFQLKLPTGTTNKRYDGKYICAVVNAPDKNIYVNEDGTKLANNYVNSSSDGRIPFAYGTTIDNVSELQAFISGTGSFYNRAGEYVLTNNINLNGASTSPSSTPFTGVFNGDYHTVANGKANFTSSNGAIFFSDMKNATVKNLILSNFNVTNTANRKSTAILVGNAIDSVISRVMVVNSNVKGDGDVAFLAGAFNGSGTGTDTANTIRESGFAGGKAYSIFTEIYSVGGLAGSLWGSKVINNFAINSTVTKDGKLNASGTLIGSVHSGDNSSKAIYQNNFVANLISGGLNGAIIGGFWDIKTHTFSNNYYDKTLAPSASLGGDEGFNGVLQGNTPIKNAKGIGKSTSEMIGTNLKSSFGDTAWKYEEGYYPRLKWNADHPVTKLYSMTSAAFSSIDGKTTKNDLLSGNIKGVVQIPTELQGSAYTYKSSNPNVLKVSKAGVITPVGKGGAEIGITYTEPDSSIGGSATNKYKFNSSAALSSFDGVDVSGTAEINKRLNATITPASTTGVTYKWYRKKADEDNNGVVISGATESTYTIKAADAGYQIRVEISKDNYGSMVSSWSSAIQVGAPSSAPIVNNISDDGATITGQGGSGIGYEYAYAETATGEKTIIPQQGESIALNGLSRNKKYFIFSRMAAGEGFDASGWGPSTSFTTLTTDIVGEIEIDSTYNNSTSLKMSIENTNDQSGTWKIERLDSDTENVLEVVENSATSYSHTYTLQADDVDKKIRVSFIGTGSYKGSQTKITPIIKKAIPTMPNAPTKASTSDNSITLNMPDSSTKYDVGYREVNDSTISVALKDVNGSTQTLSSLKRNTAYNLYVRKAENSSNEASAWSNALTVTTDKTNIVGDVSLSGSLMTKGNIEFSVDDTNNQSGLWKLEKVSDSNITTISPGSYQVDENSRTLRYEIRPSDATYTLKATFTGSSNYQGSITKTSAVIGKATLDINDLPTEDDVEVVGRSDQALNVKVTNGASVYQFGYVKTGTMDSVQLFEANGNAGKTINISGLQRNTEYDLYIREAAKTGYNPSAFVKVKDAQRTDKTSLNGHIVYKVQKDGSDVEPEIGAAKIGYTYIAEYGKGTYIPSEVDTTAGTWQWYLDGVPIVGQNTDTYTVTAMLGKPEVSVRYIAKDDSNFKDYQEAKIGMLSKSPYGAPKLPTVDAVSEDNEIGSKLKITSTDDDHSGIYWYVQDVKNEGVPELVTAEEANKNDIVEGKWFASASEVTITLNPNVEYIVYAAKLEDLGNRASSIISQRTVVSAKDDLTKIGAQIKEANEDTSWKVLQNKEIRVMCQDKATSGVWKYYVSNDKINTTPAEDSWKIISAEVRHNLNEGKTATYAYTNFQVPLKYIGYKLRVVYTGNDGYEGVISYTSEEALEGTLISGTASVIAGSDVTVGAPIEVKYNTSVEDEKGGYWRWYRDDGNSDSPEMILDDVDNPYGAVGVNDSYTPIASDVGKKIFAVFNAADSGIYTGSVRTDLLDSIQRATQNTPSAPTLAQVNGTTIQMVLPNNYSTSLATTPDVILGYKEKNSTDEITWLTYNKNNTWIKDNLKAKTTYEIFVKYERTSEFYESLSSPATEVTTGNESFDRKDLKVEADIVASGQTLHAKFTGEGYDQGFFKIVRSDESIVADRIDGTIQNNEVSMSYTFKSEDIDTNLIVQYIAKDDAIKYGGYVEKSTDKVSKPINPTSATTPLLSTIKYIEDKLQTNISSDYEYVLTTTNDPISASSGDWKKLIDTGTETYTFEGLDVNKTYYLHARLAETNEYVRGKEVISAGVKPWERGRFSISYEGVENAINENPTQYDELSEDIKLADPSKKGYTFKGWTYAGVNTPTKDVIIVKHSTENKTFTANWTINNYKVIFDCNNGSTINLNKDFNEKLSAPENPEKEGNTFKGWYKDTILSTPWDFENDVIEGSTTLYAKWEPKSYTATFQGNGGVTPLPISGKFGNTWPSLPKSERAGYEFDGWYTNAIGGEKVEATTTVPASNVTYYAQWSPIEYKIEYSLNDGNLASDAPSVYTVEDSVNLLQPTKAGYVFVGWTFEGQNVPLKSVNIALGSKGNKSFVANWKQVNYQITYDLDGGENSPLNPDSYQITDADFTLQIARKEGFVFTGWTYPGENTPQASVIITQGSQGDKEFIANWVVADAIIKFDSQGGSDVESIEAKKSSTLIAPEEPSRIGYTFTGWYKTKACDLADLWDFASDTVNNDEMTLYAGWKINDFRIVFEDPTGSNTTKNIIYQYGSELQSLLPTFTKSGYRFNGWLNALGEPTSLTSKVKEDATYTASWEIIDYNITYDLNGGENHKDNPATYTIESPTIELKVPYKEDCVFEGWSPTNMISSGTTGAQKFTATWKDADYSVVFVSNGGSIVQTIGAKANENIIQPDNPTKDGYNFVGWYKNKELTTPWDFTNDTVANDMSLYAKWEKINYSIRFMNGIIEEENRSLKYEEELGELPVVAQDGYTFKGWYPSPSEGEAISEKTKVTKDMIYYAHFDAEEYAITYDLDGGENHKDNPSTYTIETDTISLKTPFKTAYIFSGWTPSGEIALGSTGDKEFKATWQKADFEVKFDSLGGSKVNNLYAIANTLITPPEMPIKEGYIFKGWYKEKECLNEWSFINDAVANEVTLFAKWEINTYKVEFIAIPNGSVISEIIETYGETLKTLPSVNRDGYEFVGWYTKPSGGEQISETTKVVKNMVYYGQWNIKKYAITYDLNGGNNVSTNPNEFTIETDDITLSSPIQPNKAFVGWTYTGQSTPVKDVVIPKGSLGEKRFTAHWEDADFKVTFDSQLGSDVNSYLALRDGLVEKPTSPTRKGHTFAGWYKEETYQNEWNFDSDKVISDITLYAKWNKNKYTIEFDSQGGNSIGKVQREYDEEVGVLPTSTRSGYTFEGWYDAQTGGTKVEVTTKMPENKVTYYARWTAKTYDIAYSLDGGSNHEDNPLTYTIESDSITLKQPSKKDYAFEGWTYVGQTTPVKSVVIPKGNTGKRSYTANWVNATLEVTFDTQGGSEVDTFYAVENDILQKPSNPTRKGYDFVGWYKEATCENAWDFETDLIQEEVTLYAKWVARKVDVYFDAQNNTPIASVEKYFDDSVGSTNTPDKKGYIFDGWYTQKEGGDRVESSTKIEVEEKVTYYAHWKVIYYQITYNLNGGSQSYNPSSYSIESETFTINEPIKSGYNFVGWLVDGSQQPIKSINIAKGSIGDKVLVAMWDKISDAPGILPKEKPTTPATPTISISDKDQKIVTEDTEESVITDPNGKRNPDIIIDGTLENGKISIDENEKINSSNGKTIINIGNGSVIVNISSNVEVKDIVTLINSALTQLQINSIVEGTNIEIRVNVKEIEKIKSYDKVKKLAKENDLTLENSFDISITIKEGIKNWVKIIQLKDVIEITLPVKTELQNLNADFYAIRLHDEKATVLKDRDNSKKEVTVQSSQFSTYTIGYKMRSDESYTQWILWLAGVGILLGGVVLVIMSKKKSNTEH